MPLPAETKPLEDAAGAEPSPPAWRVEPLQGWHLPLLDDPAFLPLQPLLQRAVLLGLPERLMSVLRQRPPLAPQVLVAFADTPAGDPRAAGLIVGRRFNRRGTCWRIEHLRMALAPGDDIPFLPAHEVTADLVRVAIQRVPGASSWIAVVSSLDRDRLATLREQGFQPQRSESLWRWTAEASAGSGAAPSELQLRPLNRRNATLLWHLEQAACPAHLRQLLDRHVDDLLDRDGRRGVLLVDPNRNEAVAGARLVERHPCGGHHVELSVHPGWEHLLGAPLERLLLRLARPGQTLWLRSEAGDESRRSWLGRIGAEAHGDQVVMARSVWRRQECLPAERAARRLGAVLEQFQPRRRPLPTPVGQR